MSELISQSGDHSGWSQNETARGLFVGQLDEDMMDAICRLAQLLDTPKDIRALAPVRLREFHYRMLSGTHGATIAQIAIAGSNTQKISQVIRLMKSDLTRAMSVEALASKVHMSPSSFHQHFKAVTAMSPLQYLKRLRLTEARQIMLSEAMDAASTAYRVGYESPSQFNREYARMFGAPPMRDIAGLRSRAGPRNTREPRRSNFLYSVVGTCGAGRPFCLAALDRPAAGIRSLGGARRERAAELPHWLQALATVL